MYKMKFNEQRFYDYMIAGGHKIREATKYENMQLHFDFVVNGLKIETKGPKAIHAGGEITTDWMLVEWQAVRHNHITDRIGWVRGEADYIVFEEGGGYLWVNRHELETLVKYVWWHTVCKKRPYDQLYRAYGRPGRREFGVQEPDRDDKFCFVPREDVIQLLPSTKRLWFTEALKRD